MLQCLWKSIMCAMCCYELIKVTFEAKQGEMMEGGKEHAREARGGRRNLKKRANTKKRDEERTNGEKRITRGCCVFARE